MGTIPAPNIVEDAGQIAQAPQNALAEYARVAAIKQQTAASQQQTQQRAQMAPLEQQQVQQQIDAQKRQFADQDALTKAITQYDPTKHTLADVPKLITQNGGSGQSALQAQQGLITQRQSLSKLSDEQFQQQQRQADLIQGFHDEVSQADPQDKPNVYAQGLPRLAAAGVDISKESPQYPGDDAWAQHAGPVRLHSAIMAEAEKDRELTTKEQEAATKQQVADQDKWKAVPELGVRLNATTGETQPIQGASGMMPPAMQEAKYLAIQTKKNAGQPVAPDDQAFSKAYEKMKTLVPQFTINANATGAGMIPGNGQPGGQGGPPPTTDAIPPSIAGTVKQILDYRAQLPPAGRANPTNTAIRYWVNALDPQHDDTTFPARNKLMTNITSGPLSKQINATNTALGHVGVMSDAIDALDNGNIPLLNSIANRLGMAVGETPATTLKTIVHRVGPELASAYIEGGGGEGERGTTAGDFDYSLGGKQLKANAAITAQLLRSKIGATENQYKNTMGRDDFQKRFITPEAQATLDKLNPQGGAGAQHVAGGSSNGLKEGQTGTGSDGKKYVVKNGTWAPAQ